MDTIKNNTLESFVERHRADFDTHEPRPDLWAALERQLAGAAAPPAAPVMRRADAVAQPLPAAAPVAAVVRAGWLPRYGVAAALALLVFAAGASEVWKAKHPATAEVATAASAAAPDAPDAALYQSSNPVALTAGERTVGADSQLVRAVRGMETYYANQLGRRQRELRELSGPGTAAMAADWQRELVSLDSSYRQLKQELLHHPQPDAVLTAMNRNLQIRLDILDQQLHLGTAAPATAADRSPDAYVLADSRHLPE